MPRRARHDSAARRAVLAPTPGRGQEASVGVCVNGSEQIVAKERDELLRATRPEAVDGADERQDGPAATRRRRPSRAHDYLPAVRRVVLPTPADLQHVVGLDSERDAAKPQRHDVAVGVGFEDREAVVR